MKKKKTIFPEQPVYKETQKNFIEGSHTKKSLYSNYKKNCKSTYLFFSANIFLQCSASLITFVHFHWSHDALTAIYGLRCWWVIAGLQKQKIMLRCCYISPKLHSADHSN